MSAEGVGRLIEFFADHGVQPATGEPGRIQPGQGRGSRVATPGPGVAKPDLGQQVQGGRVRPVVGGFDDDADVIGRGLGVLHEHRLDQAPRLVERGVGRSRLRHPCALDLRVGDDLAGRDVAGVQIL